MGNYPAALKLFQTAVELAPDEPDYICNVGVTVGCWLWNWRGGTFLDDDVVAALLHSLG